MDNDLNHIDSALRERFSSIKDHSISPETGWNALEKQLKAEQLFARESIVGNSYWNALRPLGLAASVFLCFSLLNKDSNEIPTQQMAEISSENSSPAIHTDFSDALARTVASDTTNDPRHLNEILISNTAFSTSSISNSPLALEVAETSNSIGFGFKDKLALMPALANTSAEFGIITRLSESDLRSLVIQNSVFYAKGCLQLTNGQSNSLEKQNFWNTNFLVALGASVAIDSRSFITAEVGWIRRGGNALERTRQVETNGLQGVLNGNYLISPEPTNNIHVAQSLIANRLDYVHIPLSYHYCFPKSNVYAGIYGERLISVRNDAYMVYNQSAYVLTSLGEKPNNSPSGLSNYRCGFVVGYEYEIRPNTALVANGLIPLNGPLNDGGEYNGSNDVNAMISLQFGVKYRI